MIITILNIAMFILLYLIIGAAIHLHTFKDGGLMSDPVHFIVFCIIWLPIEIVSKYRIWKVMRNPQTYMDELQRIRTYFKEKRGIDIDDELKKH